MYNQKITSSTKVKILDTVTNRLTKEKVNCEMTYDSEFWTEDNGYLISKGIGTTQIKITANNVTHYYTYEVIYDFESMKTDFALEIKKNNAGVDQCYIVTPFNDTSRLNYDWISSDDTILKVSQYSSITIVGDGTCAIIAVHKNSGKIGVVKVTIKDGVIVSFTSEIQPGI